MTGRTHIAFGYAFSLGIMTIIGAIPMMSLIALVFIPDQATLADKDQNEKNNSIGSFLKHLSKGSFTDKLIRTIFKKFSDGEHRGLTHSIIFLIILLLILSPFILIIGIWGYLTTFLSYLSHIVIDMVNPNGVRLFYPLKIKINFLNFIPNIIFGFFCRFGNFTGRIKQIRTRGLVSLPLQLRFIIFFASLFGIFYIFDQNLDLAYNFQYVLLGILSRTTIASSMILTGEDAERIFFFRPLNAVIVALLVFNREPFFNRYLIDIELISNHIFLATILLFYALHGLFYISVSSLKNIWSVRSFGHYVAIILVIGSLYHFDNYKKQITEIKEFNYEQINVPYILNKTGGAFKDTYYKVVSDLKLEGKILKAKTDINNMIDTKTKEIKTFIGEDKKANKGEQIKNK